jgi:Sec-independent protein translocase protein TatA
MSKLRQSTRAVKKEMLNCEDPAAETAGSSLKEYQGTLRRENEKIISDRDEREAKRKADEIKAQQDLEEREKTEKTEEDNGNIIRDSVIQDGGSVIAPRPRLRPRPQLY